MFIGLFKSKGTKQRRTESIETILNLKTNNLLVYYFETVFAKKIIMSFNKSIHMLTLAWNEKRFVESKSARNAARRSIFRASTSKLKKDTK